MIRELLGLGPSKSERIADLERRLKWESAMLDQMAFQFPAAFHKVSSLDGNIKYFRPGVAMLELQQVLHARTRAQFESECG